MDAYTRRTREWLDGIYEGAPGAVYIPHSPVHGFDARARYIGTYSHVFAVLSEMARYQFDSCLDVGSGEGFLGAMVRRLFGARVAGVDLSQRACRRGLEVLSLPAAVGEVRQLPFRDESVDVIVSTNTLEHVTDVRAAYAELRRIARAFLVLGLPHARRPGESEPPVEPHAHVSLLTQAEMRDVFGRDAVVRGSVSRLARPLYALAAQDDVSSQPGYERLRRPWIRPLYAAARALARRLEARRTVARLCRFENELSRRWPEYAYESIVVVELEGARRRSEPFGAAAILRELLR